MAGTTEIVYIAGRKAIQNHMGGPAAQEKRSLANIGCLDNPKIGFFSSAPDPNDPTSVPNTSWFDTQWTCDQWMAWTNAQITAYGPQVAVQNFQTYFPQLSAFSSDGWCNANAAFVAYYKALGIDVTSFASVVVSNLASTATTTSAALAATATAVANVATSASNATGTLKWLLPVGGVILAAGGLWYLKIHFIDKEKKGVAGLTRKYYGTIKSRKLGAKSVQAGKKGRSRGK